MSLPSRILLIRISIRETVFSSRFEVVAESVDRRGVLNIDLLESRQAAIIPATVEYRLDLSNMDRDRFAWDADSETLSVVLPTPLPGAPTWSSSPPACRASPA